MRLRTVISIGGGLDNPDQAKREGGLEKEDDRPRRGGHTCLIYMPMHNRNSPRASNDPTLVLPKRRDKHMMVPRKALDKLQSALACTHASEVALESGSDVVRVRKVESLGHIHLTERREQPLFLDEVIDFVIESYRKHVRALQVVEVVPANEGDD